MKNLLSLIICIFISTSFFAQKEANIWYFGRNAGIDFNTSPPTALTDGQLNTFEGCSTFSDSNGNLLFYVGAPNTSANRLTVWSKKKDTNGNHMIMTYTNGNLANDLLGHTSSTQSAMIIPKPGSNTIYYIFTVGDQNSPNFSLYTIDMSLNGGNGQLIDEDGDGDFFENLAANVNDPNAQNSWTEKVAAVRGKRCNERWVVSLSRNKFYAYKVTNNGVNLSPVESIINQFSDNTRGYLKLSPDGTKLAVAHENSSEAFLYSFDTDLGQVANDGIALFNGSTDGRAYGVEFSSDSKKLYISSSSRFRETLNDPITSIYRLFYYNLEAIDILSSKTLIYRNNNGFRGALQLGPDGKIYTTIPQAYNDTNGDAHFLSVIENPKEENANNIIFTKDAIYLDGKAATQGLPPFLSSLFEQIKLTDSNTNQEINGEILQYCLMENLVIEPEAVTPQPGTTVTYEWAFDNGTNTTVLSSTTNLTLNNLDFTNAGDYILTVTLTDECGNPSTLEGTFTLEVYNNLTPTAPTDINFCDTDGDGLQTFDFQTDLTPTILNSQDPNLIEVLYYPSEDDAINNNIPNQLPNPYTPSAFFNDFIWVRVHNRLAPNASCREIYSFNLQITGEPIAQTPNDISVCDDTASGSDTDGLFTSFLLNTKDAEILGSLSPVQYTVSYHTSITGAETSSTTNAIDKNVNYQSENDIIYVRVENVDNADCNDTSQSFELIINPLPTPIDVTILQCDDDADLTSDVNLTLEQSNISANHASETFEYFETFAQADAGTPVIPNPISYNANNGDQVWVRTITSQGCYRISQIDITISFAADVAYNRTFIQCDDFLDADGNDNANNDDADGITFFDFSDAKTDILAFFPLPVRNDLDVKFFETIPDRASEINDISDISNHRNNNDPAYANQQTIYAKIINTVNNDCNGLSEFTLQVTPVPTANPINTTNELEECDNLVDGDATNGIVQNWDLEALTPTILGSQSATAYTVTYHEEEMDAQNGLNPIDTNVDYTNTSNPQTIYVLVAGNGCEYDRYTFDLVVTSLPVANAINMANTHEVCDNDEDGSAINGFVQNQDLEVLTPTILGTQDPANFIVTYHTSLALAQSNGTAIISGNYTNDSNTDIVYVRIEDRTTGCVNDTFNFTFQVNSEPLGYTPSNLSLCDNDGDGDDTNGLVQTFDLESQIPDILGDSMVQDQDDFNVTFHLSQEDATSGDTPESSPFTNTIINQQTIYVRIENKATGCINDDVSFDVIVNPLPDFQVTSPQMICLNNPPLTLVAENPNQVYAYQWFDTNGNSLGGSISIEVTSGGEYTVTATTTNGTNCSRTRTIIVNESNIASIEQQDVTIDDDIYIDGTTTNSITINNTDNNLGVGDYEFALLNEQEIIIRDYQDAPVFNNLEGGIYTIHVRDKNGCGVATLTVAVLEVPKFFTPNGDGYNDSWVIKGANNTFFPTNSVLVFDRLGKIITKFSFNSRGWNGRYKNNLMPSNDYWYTINLTDRNGNNHSKKGHFSLIRK